MSHNELCAGQRASEFENIADMHTFPRIIITTPGSDTVEICGQNGAWQGQKFIPAQFKRILYLSGNLQFPVIGQSGWCALIAQHRPFLRQVLSGWQTVSSIGSLL